MALPESSRAVERVVEKGQPSPDNDDQLRSGLGDLVGTEDGLAWLQAKLDKKGWGRRFGFLRFLLRAAQDEWQGDPQRVPKRLEALVRQVAEVTPACESVHWGAAFLLYRMEARYEYLIHKDLLQDSPKVVGVAFQAKPGGPIPREQWIPFLEPLREVDLTPSERHRLEQLIERFAAQPANPGPRTGPDARDLSAHDGRRANQPPPSAHLSGPPMRKAPAPREQDQSAGPAETPATHLQIPVGATRVEAPVTPDDETKWDGPTEAAAPPSRPVAPVEVTLPPVSVDGVADVPARVDSPEQESPPASPNAAMLGSPPTAPQGEPSSPPEEETRSNGPGSPIEWPSASGDGGDPTSPAPATDLAAVVPVEVEAVPTPAEGGKPPRTRTARPRKSSKAAEGVGTGTGSPVDGPPAPPEEIESYLARVSREILERFRTRPESSDTRLDLDPAIRAAREEADRLRSDVRQLQSRLQEREVELLKVREALEAANHAVEAKSVALAGLEELLAAARARLPFAEEGRRRAEAEVERLKKEVDEALVMIEESERRASDQVHSARLDAEETLRTFLAKLSRKIEPLLGEGMDDPGDRPELTPEQSKFHQRLRRILSVLRDLGMPPT
jgi:hypothetical protein